MESTTLYSWMGAVTIGGLLFAYYTNGTRYFMQSTPPPPEPASIRELSQTPAKRRRQEKDTGRRKETIANKAPASDDKQASYAQIASTGTQNTNATKKRKAGRGTVSQPAAPVAQSISQDDDDDGVDEEYGDKEWARQLEARKKGVALDKAPGPGRPNRPKAQGLDGESTLSSNAASKKPAPALGGGKAVGDVSDMLEAPAPGPAVIRITGEEKAKKLHAPKAEPPKETKKQRQNRRKVEEQKVQREEDERRRKALEEKQRREARLARGEPAKNGLSGAVAPTSSAWTSNGQVPHGTGHGSQGVQVRNDTQLLDTFDQDALSTSSSNDLPTSVTTPATVASTLDGDFPSEEAQMAMLNDMSGWNEVSTKSKKGKKKDKSSAPVSPPNEAVSTPIPIPFPEKSSNPYSAIATNDLINGSTKPKPTVLKNASGTNVFASVEETTAIGPSAKGHPDDSDWAA